MKSFQRKLLRAAAAPFWRVSFFAYFFARGKLKGDPIFRDVLERGLVPDGARLLDLGCGQGVLAAWLLGARALFEAGGWTSAWPEPPRLRSIFGVELMPRDVARARRALGDRVRFEVGDIRTVALDEADVVAIFDVLHYIDYDAQEAVLRRVRAALVPGGRLVTRFGDAAGGLRFFLCNLVDHCVAFTRGHRLPRLYCRPLAEWTALLERLGFRVETLPMNGDLPFANVMVVADRVDG